MGQAQQSPSEVRDAVSAEIAAEKVLVYSKSYCPYCRSTKELLSQNGVAAKIVELDTTPDGPQIQAALLDLTKQRTVPNVFVGGKHVGGNDDLQGLARANKLVPMLDAAGVAHS